MQLEGQSLFYHSHAESGGFSFHSPSPFNHGEALTIPDAHLLFSGDYARSGNDLIISDHLQRFVLPNYFSGEKRPMLVSPEGAPLDSRFVGALTGHVEYAQAGAVAQGAKVVGHVVNMTGSASIVRNGVAVVANTGDTLYQTDVVQTGSNSTLGLVLDDGTAFNLSANARFMLNDFNYDPTSTSNHSLLSLLQGAATFVAGQVAKTGGMEVGTPVAVIGIRGTAVLLDINAVDGKVSISVADQQDQQLHSVQVFKCVPAGLQGVCSAGDLIGTITSNGPSLTLTPAANFEVITQEINKTPDQVTQEFNSFQQVLGTYDAGKQLYPNLPQHTENTNPNNNSNTGTTKTALGSTPILPSEPPTTTVFSDTSNTKVAGSLVPATLIVNSGNTVGNGSTASSNSSSDPTQVMLSAVLLPASPVAITNTGGTTNLKSVTITGTADSGTTVTLLDTYNGATTQIGTTTVGPGGVWTANVTLKGDGVNTIVAQDASANSTSAPVVFMLNSAPPSVTITSSGGPTKQAAQTISGTVAAAVGEAAVGSTVTLFDTLNGVTKEVGTAPVGAGGNWSTTVTLSGNGAHSIVAQDTDVAGNTGASTPVTFTLAALPTLTIDLVDGNNVINHTEALAGVALTGTVSGIAAGSTFNVTVTDNGVIKTYVATVNTAGTSWSATIPASDATALANGTATVSAQVSDANGNQATASQTVTVAETGPTLTIDLVDGNNVINHTEALAGVALTGTVSGIAAGSTFNVTVTDNGVIKTYVATVNTAGTSWSATIPASDATALANGTATVSAQVSDANGNQATASQTVTVAETGPTLTIDLVDGNNVINHTEALAGVALTGTVSGIAAGSTFNVTVTDNGVIKTYVATVNTAGTSWSATIPASDATALANGTATVSAQVSDANGNQATASQTVTVAETGPTLTIDLVDGNNVINHTEALAGVALTGTVSGIAAGSTFNVTVTDNGVIKTYVATVNTAGTSWSATIPASDATALANGTATVSAQVSDANGNQATASQTVTVAETGPTLTIDLVDGNNVINHTEALAGVALTGTVSGIAAGSTFNVTVTDNGVIKTYVATVNTAGTSWSATIPASDATALANGTATVSAQVSDANGNQATASQTVTVAETGPTLTISVSNTNVTAIDNTATVTFAFSEAPTAFSLSDVTSVGGTLSNLQQIDATHWTALFTANSNTQTTNASVTVTVGSYQDAAGNLGTAAGSGDFSVDTVPNSWANSSGGSWTDPTNWSSGTVPSSSANVQISPYGSTPYTITILPTASAVVNSLTLSDPNATLVEEGTLSILSALTTIAGVLEVSNGGTLSVGNAAGFTVDFTGTGGGLALDSNFTGTVNAISNANGSVTIAGGGNVTTVAGDAVDLSATGGTQNNPANLSVGLTGAITGAANGIAVTQNAFGDIAIATSGPVIGEAGRGISAEEGATGIGSILVSGSGNVTGIGSANSGIFAEILNPADGRDVNVDQTGNISGGYDGIRATTYGNGKVTVFTGPNALISGGQQYGIIVLSYGTGNLSISTTTNDTVTSNSAGIVAQSDATSIPQIGGTTTNSISVTAVGTINSGSALTALSNAPAGIIAGYEGATSGNGTPNAAVFGNVIVSNSANINAAGGDGIRTFNYGNGNITVNELANTTIAAPARYGILASIFGAGDISISTSVGDTINSGSTGIQANDEGTAVSSTSTVSVTAFGTINSGVVPSGNNSQPSGIAAGYNNGGTNTVNSNVQGNVVVDSSASIDAAWGVGVSLYNFGVGNLTATLETPSATIATATGVNAYAQGGGNVSITNNGTITVVTGVGISTGTGNGAAGSVSGVISVTNSGTVSALGSINSPVIQINNDSTQGATFTNSGTITSDQFSSSSQNQAVGVYNGSVVVNNSGTITGNVSLTTGTFNNNGGGIWNVNGSNNFGNGANAINNAGTVNVSGVTVFSTSGTLAFDNANAVDLLPDSYAFIGGPVSGLNGTSGTFSFGKFATLEFASSVAAGQTISFIDGSATLTIDNPSGFDGTLANLQIGDIIQLPGVSIQSVAVNSEVVNGVTEQFLQVTSNNQPLFLDNFNNGNSTYEGIALSNFAASAQFSVLSSDEILLVPAGVPPITGSLAASSTPTSVTAQAFFILSDVTTSGSSGFGFAVSSSDATPGDFLTVEISQGSSISGLSGTFNGVNLVATAAANVALINAGTITSAGGRGVNTSSGTGALPPSPTTAT